MWQYSFIFISRNFTSPASSSNFQTNLRAKFGLSKKKYFVLVSWGFFPRVFLLSCHHSLCMTPDCVWKKKLLCSFPQMSHIIFVKKGINCVKRNNLFRLKLSGWTQEKLKYKRTDHPATSQNCFLHSWLNTVMIYHSMHENLPGFVSILGPS